MAKYLDETGLAYFWETVQEAIPSADYNDLTARPLDVELVGTLDVPTDTYAQGSTSDGTYFYVMWSPTSGSSASVQMRKYDSELSLIASMDFTGYENVGHGNSITYDSVNGYIVVYSSNLYVTLVSTDMEVINQYATGTTSTQSYVSQIAMDENYLVLNQSATNNYIFYKRLNDKFFAMYAVANIPQPRGVMNLLQDCFMYDEYVFSVSSSGSRDTYIAVFGVNAAFYTNLRIIGIAEEFEGCFVYDSYAYFVTNVGSVYRASISDMVGDLGTGDTQNPSMGVQTSRIVPTLYRSIATDVFTSTATTSHGNVTTRIPNVDTSAFAKTISWAPERSTILGANTFSISSISNGSLRIPFTFYDSDGEIIMLWIVFTVASRSSYSKCYQYLSEITLAKGGSKRTISFSDGDANMVTKLDSLWASSETPHLSSGSGIIVYGHNKLVKDNDAFFGLIES